MPFLPLVTVDNDRVLGLYLSVENPLDEHTILIYFIFKPYMPIWKRIRKSNYFTDGCDRIFKVRESTRCLPDNLIQAINLVIKCKAFFLHPEYSFHCMIVGEKDHNRELGFTRLIKAKDLGSKIKSIRSFQVPIIKFQAKEYVEVIDCYITALTLPPLLQRESNKNIW